MGLLQVLQLPPPPSQRAAQAAAARLSQAAADWRRTHQQARERVAALQESVKAQCADAPPALRKQVDTGLARLDQVLSTVDERLADALTDAGRAKEETARAAELKKAKAILAQYLQYVASEPLVAHIDRNPFQVETGLKALLASALADAAKAIG